MRHHQPIVDMRLAGFRPASVHLESGDFVPEWQWWPEWHPELAYVEIEAADTVERLDLRFIVGCEVHVNGEDPKRVRALFDAAVSAKAGRVFATSARLVAGKLDFDFLLDSERVSQ